MGATTEVRVCPACREQFPIHTNIESMTIALHKRECLWVVPTQRRPVD